MKHEGMIRKRTIWLGVAVGVYFIALLVRLFYLQVINPSEITRHAEAMWSRNLPIEGQRGIIYDRNRNVLVNNVVAPSVIVIPRQVTQRDQVTSILAEILESDADRLDEKIWPEKHQSVARIQPEGRKLNNEQVLAIKAADLDGVYLVNDVMRYYPHGTMLAHSLGFTGIDNQGLTGLEYLYNDYLLGASGAWKYFSSAKGHSLERFSDLYAPSSRGMDMVLTIDARIQEILEREADNAMARYRPDQLMMFAMDPNTGAILGMTSRPTFNPAAYQDYEQEIFNRNLPIWMTFEPGSTFKVPVFAAALEEGLMELDDPFNCVGYAVIEGTRIRDWKAGGHGTITMLDVIAQSCNPGFMHIGVDLLGKDLLFQYIEAFGFKEKTGIDMLGESLGLIFNPEVIGPVEVATSAFGQGNSVTPIQLVNAIAATINGGYLMTPHIVYELRHPYTDEVLMRRQPKVRRQVISNETSEMMRLALETTGAQGGGRGAYIEGMRVGGKTGTAQKPAPGGGYKPNEYILSFVGAAPMDNPQIIIYVAIDNPRDTVQYGGVVAAPIARNIFREVLPYLGIEPREGSIPKEYIWGDVRYTEVPDYVGQKRSEIYTQWSTYEIRFFGSGSVVTRQQPAAGSKIAEDGIIRLYLGE